MADFSFLAQPYQPPSPVQTLGSLYALRSQQQEMAQRQQLMQNEQLQYAQNSQAWRDQQAVRKAYLDNQNPDGSFNQGGFLTQVRQTAPLQFPQVVQQQAQIQQTQLAATKGKADYVGQLMNGVSDQGSWNRAIHSATMQGIDTSQWPALYDPKFTGSLASQAQTVSDFVKSQTEQGTLAETSRHNLVDEGIRRQSIPLPNQVTAAYGVPQNQRTPDQNALLTGWGQYNYQDKILPGIERAIAGARARPVQVAADPNHPGNLTYVPAGQAMGSGAAAPGSAATQAAIDTAVSATSGPIGNTLNSFNTAQGHLSQLRDASAALKNGDGKAFNELANYYGVQTGQAAPVVFQAVKSAVAGEVSKAFKGGQATDAEIEEFDKAINAANSPAQLQAVADTYTHLLQSKKDALAGQVQQGMKGQPNWQNAPASNLNKPRDGATKKNGAGDNIVYRGGKWVLAQ